jgi:hypothetical protein
MVKTHNGELVAFSGYNHRRERAHSVIDLKRAENDVQYPEVSFL